MWRLKAIRLTVSNACGYRRCAIPDAESARPAIKAPLPDCVRMGVMRLTFRAERRAGVWDRVVSYWSTRLWARSFRPVTRAQPVRGERLVPPYAPGVLPGIGVDRSRNRRGSVGFGPRERYWGRRMQADRGWPLRMTSAPVSPKGW